MADEEFPEEEPGFSEEVEDDAEPEELDEDELPDDDEFGLEEGADDDALETDDDEVEGEETEAEAEKRRKATAEEDDDDEDLVDPDDVEADLDTILKDRLVAADDEAEDDDEVEVDDRGDPVDRIQPKRPGEFVCQSCFLVKHPSQLADEVRMLCRDCV